MASGFVTSEAHVCLLRLLGIMIFACSNLFNYYYFKRANNKGVDQTAQMCSRVCAFIVCMQQNQVFLDEAHMTGL